MVLAQPSINSFQDLKGKKIAVQNGSIGLVSLNWKLKQEKVFGDVEIVFMDNQDQPIPLMRGDVAAICVFEPYAALAELSGWGKKLWVRSEAVAEEVEALLMCVAHRGRSRSGLCIAISQLFWLSSIATKIVPIWPTVGVHTLDACIWRLRWFECGNPNLSDARPPPHRIYPSTRGMRAQPRRTDARARTSAGGSSAPSP
jgi:hypothetical protein